MINHKKLIEVTLPLDAINKAMVEIPPKFAGQPLVNLEVRKDKELFKKGWRGAQGLAEDVR